MGTSQLSTYFALLWLLSLSACSKDKQVPFGLEEAPTRSAGAAGKADEADEASAEPAETTEQPSGEVFEPGRVEISLGETAMVLEEGYALAALRVDLDEDGTLDLLAASAGGQQVRLHAAQEQGLGTRQRQIDAFTVPEDCLEPVGRIDQLSPSLAAVRVEHRCATGIRTNSWLVTLEAQPRVRERITLLGPTPRSDAAMQLALRALDVDEDGYDDVIANVTIAGLEVPLTWLNRPGGFTRNGSQPEAALGQAADAALQQLGANPAAAIETANQVLQAYVAICRESGAARIGLSGTQGVQCGRSSAAGQAASLAIEAAIRQRAFVDALGSQRQWEASGLQLDEVDAERVRSAWRNARSVPAVRWRTLASEPAPISLYFEDEDHLIVGGKLPRRIELSSNTSTFLDSSAEPPPVVDPNAKIAVRAVRHSCQGIEAELRPVGARRSFGVPIAPEARRPDCASWIDRPVSLFDWQVLGWAPQGLVAAQGDRTRIVPLDRLGKPAGPPSDLNPDTPLPAPIRGPSVSTDGSRQAIPLREGILLRQWGHDGDLWLRPAQWDAVPGELRAIALSPSARRVAVQKGSAIQLLEW